MGGIKNYKETVELPYEQADETIFLTIKFDILLREVADNAPSKIKI